MYETVLTVQRVAFATWRRAMGNPDAGRVVRVERYVASERELLRHRPTNGLRWDDGAWIGGLDPR